ncbi:GAS2-like protein 2 [Fukomys damarensis]|uniref:GAS2-like protein 2 n=1 Tax=Fukomys damarensis TaxID=885580 RepID=A0A091DVP5_FUKDA|nr:GAS2-like protein 2 [Fukomys damarensis]
MSQLWGHRKRCGALGPPVRSIRPFKSSEQYLEAMKEDLAEWLRDLYGLEIQAANFLQVLETGLVLCQHANMVTEAALAFLAKAPAQAQRIPMPRAGVSCNGAAQPGTFQARDNVSNFIQWCRKEMGIQEVLMFETEDLVLGKNVKNVVLCLLELGRRAWRFGVVAPTLVQLEEEIDAELRQDLIQNLVSHCTCPVQFSMVKVSEGKYQVGDSNTLIFIRILRNHVMVRVGGGWDTLGHYLDKHDPCRCTSLSHKPVSFLKPSAPLVQHEVRVQDGPSPAQPTMTISRSQSPLPPVDWKTYTASGRKLRPSFSSPPRPCSGQGAGSGALRQTAPFLRSQERFLTSSQRQLSAGDSKPNPQFSSTHRNQDQWCTPSGKRETRYPAELPRGRTPTSWVHEETASRGTRASAPTPQKPQTPQATTKETSARGPCPLPHYSSPAQPLGRMLSPWGEAERASLQLREPVSVRSPSPAKGLTKIPVLLSPARPPTPGRSFPGTLSGGPIAELSRGPIPVRVVMGDLARCRHEDISVEGRRQGYQQADIQVTAEAGEPQELGPQEWEGRCTLLPLGRPKEQTIYCSHEEEIVSSVKKLEVGIVHPQGAEPPPVIPRSAVYVPSPGGRWPELRGLYDQVIQELARGPPPLLKVDLGAWNIASTESPKPAVTAGPGDTKEKLGARDSGPLAKASPHAKGTQMWKVSPPGGQNCSAPNVSASPEVPTPLPSGPTSHKANGCQGKGKRTLRKPKKVPSIYKLKLRPRIRPRKDHRPEKHPSRIPKPLAYLCLGPARAPPRERPLRAALGSKREAPQVDGASAREEEEEKKKEPPAPLERSHPPWEGQGPQQLDQVQLPLEEESWV